MEAISTQIGGVVVVEPVSPVVEWFSISKPVKCAGLFRRSKVCGAAPIFLCAVDDPEATLLLRARMLYERALVLFDLGADEEDTLTLSRPLPYPGQVRRPA